MSSVVVVSDDHLEIAFLEAALGQDERWELTSVRAGTPASAPDVMIVDMEMSGALSTLEDARRGWPGCALVLRSGREPSELRLAGKVAGAIGFLHEDLPALDLGNELSRLLALVRQAEVAAKHRLAAHPVSAAEARRLVKASLGSASLDDVSDDAALLVTELVSNAVRHAGSELEVTVVLRPGTVRIEVADFSPGGTIEALPADGEAEGGRGLSIVDTLSSRWGVNTHPGGKTIWFELDQ